LVDAFGGADPVSVMIRPNFLSRQERLELERCVHRQREDHGIARRANAVLLLDKGKTCVQIAEFADLDDNTIRAGTRPISRMVGTLLPLMNSWEAIRG